MSLINGPISLERAQQLFRQGGGIIAPTYPDYHVCDRIYGENIYHQSCSGPAITLITQDYNNSSPSHIGNRLPVLASFREYLGVVTSNS